MVPSCTALRLPLQAEQLTRNPLSRVRDRKPFHSAFEFQFPLSLYLYTLSHTQPFYNFGGDITKTKQALLRNVHCLSNMQLQIGAQPANSHLSS